jgi:DNA-binding GntR family transcriptional regulator
MRAKLTETPTGGVDTSAPQDISGQDATGFDVYRRLRTDIVDCRFKPDQRLRFETLRDTYGASVGTLREALSHLVSDGLVRTEAGRGFRVAPVSVADLMDITEWRVEFEVRAATLSIENGNDAWEAEIVTAFHLLSLAPFPAIDASHEVWAEYGRRHKRFHDAIAAACGSPWLLHFRSVLFDQARRYQAMSIKHLDARALRKEDDHRAIMKAALDRNAERAAQLVEQHVRRTTQAVLKDLASTPAQARARAKTD